MKDKKFYGNKKVSAGKAIQKNPHYFPTVPAEKPESDKGYYNLPIRVINKKCRERVTPFKSLPSYVGSPEYNIGKVLENLHLTYNSMKRKKKRGDDGDYVFLNELTIVKRVICDDNKVGMEKVWRIIFRKFFGGDLVSCNVFEVYDKFYFIEYTMTFIFDENFVAQSMEKNFSRFNEVLEKGNKENTLFAGISNTDKISPEEMVSEYLDNLSDFEESITINDGE